MTVACPAGDRLERMLDDRLGPAEAALVERHVATCPACQADLERLTRAHPTSDETLWDAAAVPDDGSPVTLVGLDDLIAGARGVEAPLPVVPGYRVEREVGRGGMGVVYLARRDPSDHPVALKMVPVGRARAADLVRFRIEVEVLARLQHPNIVQVFDVGVAHGRPYFTMEFVPGGTLADAIAEGCQPPREAAGLVEVLARAVHAAHQAGIVHRDLKPGNILLAEAPPGPVVPKITDFGLAKRVGDIDSPTQTGQILGTPSYMAPEQANDNTRVGIPADVYALGAILYELLTGRPPVRGASPWETLMRVVHEPVVPPSRVRGDIPRDLEVICLKCLHKAPADRYPDADALAEDLRRHLATEPIHARAVGAIERARLWATRHPVAAGVGGTLIAASLIGAAAGAARWRHAEARLGRAEARLVASCRATLDRLIQTRAAGAREPGRLDPGTPDRRAVDWAIEVAEELLQDHPGRRDHALILGQTTAHLGLIRVEDGRPDEARPHLERAVAVLRPVVAADPAHAPACARTCLEECTAALVRTRAAMSQR